ncbi:alkaline phosphatase [Echinicola marina]|uniref:alkaline phosphatase n=1 Tax=Echinicola marina TaxID=2859768 RepID=UPI001CF691F2|nr:alkaline phosphatase [Echinicola marina]UCS92022.1 alkaline phosphatase [Echinicola marina]
MKIRIIFTFFYFLLSLSLLAQEKELFKLHSHNDYKQNVPFWTAFASHCASIEADVLLVNGELMVAHERESIKPGQTLESLYLAPIRKAKDLGLPLSMDFQLLVDIKTEAYATMEVLEKVLEDYRDILSDGAKSGVQVVVSGSRPDINDYKNYSDLIRFDYQDTDLSKRLPWDKIALVSLPYSKYSVWNGKGRLVAEEEKVLKELIKTVHDANRPIRFWGAPDSKTAWKAFFDLGIDYINTDQPNKAYEYLSKLDKNLVITKYPHAVYQPEYLVDGQEVPIEQIIMMVGDGNGLAHISAGVYANGGVLNLSQLKHIALVKTQSADDFTTDSAAGATALATGEKVNNRAIGFSVNETPLKNLPEILKEYNFNSGIVTTDHVTGATPSSFYAHRMDRGMTLGIAEDLANSPLSLFIGAGKNDFVTNGRDLIQSLETSGFSMAKSIREIAHSGAERIGYFASNQGLPTVNKGREDYLLEATRNALSFLDNKQAPFFLLIEGAMIDSGGHINDAGMVVEEEVDFDLAIGEVLKYADDHPGTLVLITADHETGGVTLPQGNIAEREVELEFSTHDHTGIMVPLFAYGAHASAFTGVYENTDIFKRIMELVHSHQQVNSSN